MRFLVLLSPGVALVLLWALQRLEVWMLRPTRPSRLSRSCAATTPQGRPPEDPSARRPTRDAHL